MCSRRGAAPAEAELVVVNHHLLLADLALKEEGWGDILPTADAVILDEAHQLPELAAQFFGVQFSSRGRSTSCCADLPGLLLERRLRPRPPWACRSKALRPRAAGGVAHGIQRPDPVASA